MKKIFGVQAEFNITADDDIVKGVGKGVSSGSVVLVDLVKEMKPAVLDTIKALVFKNAKTENAMPKPTTTEKTP